MNTKICSKCKKEKPLSKFRKDKRNSDGCGAECKECTLKRYRKYNRNNPEKRRNRINKYNRKFKQRAVNYKGGKCQVCGYNKCLAALDFHHINPKEKNPQLGKRGISLRRVWNKNIIEELNKCICICANCHRELHYNINV